MYFKNPSEEEHEVRMKLYNCVLFRMTAFIGRGHDAVPAPKHTIDIVETPVSREKKKKSPMVSDENVPA